MSRNSLNHHLHLYKSPISVWQIWIISLGSFFFIFPLFLIGTITSTILGIVILLILYLFIAKIVKVFYFQNDKIVKHLPIHFRNIEISYDDLDCVELRKIRAPGQLPYVILHMNKEKIKSLNFLRRSFSLEWDDDLKKLIRLLIEKNVVIKLNISEEYTDEKSEIKEFISNAKKEITSNYFSNSK